MAEPAKVYQLPTKTRRQPSVRSWRINEIEEEALIELPPEVERLYQHGIRKHMDYATGITGRKRRVSMDMFIEIVEYHPPAGSREKARLYSRQQVTRMLDKLESAGLIERLHRGKGVKAAMEFHLPLACSDLDEHRAESEPAGASQEKSHSRASGEGNTEQGSSNEERSTSGIPVTPLSPNGESVDARQASSKRRKWGEEVDHEMAEQMFAAISADLTNPKRPNMSSWANEFRLMRTRDERTVEQIRFLITWTAKHQFWSGVILSPAKLRAKWDQLEIQVKKLKESRHANRQGSSAQRTDRDVIASRLADPNDSDWIDGLFDEDRPAQGAGEPDIHSTGSDLPPDMANGFHDAGDAFAGEAGGSYIDGEVVGATYEPCGGHGDGADQSRGRRVAPERSAVDQEPAAEAGGFWNA